MFSLSYHKQPYTLSHLTSSLSVIIEAVEAAWSAKYQPPGIRKAHSKFILKTTKNVEIKNRSKIILHEHEKYSGSERVQGHIQHYIHFRFVSKLPYDFSCIEINSPQIINVDDCRALQVTLWKKLWQVCLNAIFTNLFHFAHSWSLLTSQQPRYKTMKRRPCLCTKKNRMGIKFSCKNFLLFQETCLATDHVRENDLYLFYSSTSWSMHTSLTFQLVIRISKAFYPFTC